MPGLRNGSINRTFQGSWIGRHCSPVVCSQSLDAAEYQQSSFYMFRHHFSQEAVAYTKTSVTVPSLKPGVLHGLGVIAHRNLNPNLEILVKPAASRSETAHGTLLPTSTVTFPSLGQELQLGDATLTDYIDKAPKHVCSSLDKVTTSYHLLLLDQTCHSSVPREVRCFPTSGCCVTLAKEAC